MQTPALAVAWCQSITLAKDGWLRELRGSASVGVASAGIVGGTAVKLGAGFVWFQEDSALLLGLLGTR